MNESKKRIIKRRYSDTSLIDYHITYQKFHQSTKTEDYKEVDEWFPIRQTTVENANYVFTYSRIIPKKSRFILSPESIYKIIFDAIHGLFIIMQLITIPYLICFEDPAYAEWRKVNGLLNFLFYFEVLLKFNTAFYENGHLICTRREIAIKYLKTWLIYDIFACFPFDAVFKRESDEAQRSHDFGLFEDGRFIVYIQTLQLLRYFKLKGIIDHISNLAINTRADEWFKFFKLFLIGALVNHYTACAWYYLSYLDSFHVPKTWIKVSTDLRGPTDLVEYYFQALYFAATTLFTIGYGDVLPYTKSEKFFCIIIMSTGVLIFSYIESRISQTVVEKSEERAKLMEYLVNLNNFMKTKKLPSLLKYKVRTYMDYVRSSKADSELKEMEVLKILSPPLREDILGVTRGKQLRICTIFQQLYGTKLINEISKLLQLKNFAPEDILFKQGENESIIYFITSGIAEIYHEKTNTVFKELSDNTYFGEIGFFTRQVRTASARCVAFCDMMTLSREELDSLIKLKPDAFQRTLLLQTLCQKDDKTRYIPLGINCYLCNELGHTAIKCDKIAEKYNPSKMREKWIKKKMTSKVFKLSEAKESCGRRRKRKDGKLIATPLNSSASFRSPEELWKGNDNMLLHINTHLQQISTRHPTQRGFDSKRMNTVVPNGIVPRTQSYLNVLDDDDFSDDSEEVCSSRFLNSSNQSLSAKTDSAFSDKYLIGSSYRERLLSFPEAHLSANLPNFDHLYQEFWS
ncbi:unnamed protein product [Blepharisma stoltei]|uniref:Cyclic nucleotide-binding domain-containing protein n=1 Tax=Blepharisma stoltei TaxID=1481888 RepID=A0AAU9IR40_9CILI|nr:unnamed protein product [Blepharisma stoltei]